jgi:membrane peptidoglycan carboxypeptidase
MKDVVRRGTASGAVWGAGFHYPAGGKTGTTNDGTNVWFIGYTADLVAGAWMGFDRPQPIKSNAQGGVLAAPAWTAFMTEVYRRKPPPPDWPRPIAIVTRDIDVSSGLLQTPYCPRNLVTTEFYISGTEPTRDCDKHGPYANPGLTPIDTSFSTVPSYTPPPSGGYQQPVRPTSPTIQPGYEPVPSSRRVPTVFDTTRRNPPPAGDTIRPNNLNRRDTTRGNPTRRDTTRGNLIPRDTSRAGTSPPPPPPDKPR